MSDQLRLICFVLVVFVGALVGGLLYQLVFGCT